MSTNPRHASTAGGMAGIHHQIATLKRQVRNLSSGPGVIDAIDGSAIAPDSITTNQIAANTITAGDIAAGTITTTEIAANTITAGDIAANTITAGQIAAGTITSTQIQAGSIVTASLAAGSITTSLIAAGAVIATSITSHSITALQIAAGTITATEIAANTITAGQILAATITAAQIAAHTITAANIAAGTITATEIAATTITAGNIVSHTITALQIAAGTITATEITAGTITGSLIAATTITAGNIAAGTITSTQLAANSVTSTQIVSGAVTSTKISVSQLSAIAADLGTITAGTVTGATVQTASSGARVVLNTSGITAYNASNVAQLFFDTSTGNLSLTGTVTANASSILPVGALSGLIGSGSFVQNGGFEDPAGATGWVNNSNCTITTTGAQARSGARAGVMTAGGAANTSIIATAAAQSLVQPSVNHTASAWFKAATTGRTVRVHINWYTAASAFISTSSSTATTADVTGGFIRTTLTAQAPATAFFARVIAEVVSPASTEVHYVDDITLAIGDYATDVPSFPANTIVGNQIIADQITAREIASSTITATEILANTITAGQIATGTITATQIASGTITATQLSATAIDAMTVTGATLRTGSTNFINQVVMDSGGLRAYGNQLSAPTGLNLTDLGAGGTLPAATYYYKVTALTSLGETIGSTEASLAIAANHAIFISWNTVPGAATYRVYRGTATNSQTGYFLANTQTTYGVGDSVSGQFAEVTDTNIGLTAASVPVANTAYLKTFDLTAGGLGTITGATLQTSDTDPDIQIGTSGMRIRNIDITGSGASARRLVFGDGTNEYGSLRLYRSASSPSNMLLYSVGYIGDRTGGPKPSLDLQAMWSDAANGRGRIQLQGGGSGSQIGTVDLEAWGGASGRNANLQVQSGTSFSSEPEIWVQTTSVGGTNSGQITILRADGNSSFLRHVSLSSRKFNMGTSTTGSFANGNRVSGNIAHGLGVTPQGAVVTAANIAVFSGSSSDSVVTASVTGLSSTNLSTLYRIDDGFSNNSCPVYWIAWG